MRKILGDGVKAVCGDDHCSVFVLGPSNRPDSLFAPEICVQIETPDGDKYIVPLNAINHMILRVTHVAIWDAINAYTTACGGNTGAATVGKPRQLAVVAVEKALRGDGPSA